MYQNKWIYIDASNANPERKGLFYPSSCRRQKTSLQKILASWSQKAMMSHYTAKGNYNFNTMVVRHRGYPGFPEEAHCFTASIKIWRTQREWKVDMTLQGTPRKINPY